MRRGNETVLSSFSYQQRLCVPPMSPDLASSGHTHSFFCLISMRKFLFSEADLLSHPFELQHLGIACSWDFRRHCLTSNQHRWTLASPEVFSQGTSRTSFLNSLKSALLRFRMEVLLALFLLSTKI